MYNLWVRNIKKKKQIKYKWPREGMDTSHLHLAMGEIA